MNNTFQIWSTSGVWILCAITCLLVVPYAVRELWIDRRRLTGQFAIGLVLVFGGIAGRLVAAWVFYYTPPDGRVAMLATLDLPIQFFNLLIAGGALWSIRLITRRYREWVWILALLASALGAIFLNTTIAGAQEHHHRHHAFYEGWVNQNDKGCCNNQDCGVLKDVDERTTPTGVEVRIEGNWCPVLSHHYLKKGNAPNWSTSHVCVQAPYSGDGMGASDVPVCERLLCYQPKPGS